MAVTQARQYAVECNTCGDRLPGTFTDMDAAAKAAKDEGWHVDLFACLAYCPECKPRHMRPRRAITGG